MRLAVEATPVLALRGGWPVRTAPWPHGPSATPVDLARVSEVLRAGTWGGTPRSGSWANQFCDDFLGRLGFGAAHGALVANGSVALEIALAAVGVVAGDEVITTPYTWVASATAIVRANAVPVFADVAADRYCLDPAAVEAAITPRTRAILVVHIGHCLTDMDAIAGIAARHRLVVIEDCAHAHFARWRGRAVGTIGDVGVFSFSERKIITAGEGGLITSRDAGLAARCRALADCGRGEIGAGDPGDVGWNARITEMQAALLVGQLAHYDALALRRRSNVSALLAGLGRTGVLEALPGAHDPRAEVGPVHALVLRYRAEAVGGCPRADFLAAVRAEGVPLESGDRYPLLPGSPLFDVQARRWPMIRARYGERIADQSEHLPNATAASRRDAVWIHHALYSGDAGDVADVIAAVAKVAAHADQLAEAS